ncbi:MAG: primosomal replication protein PriB/PriC domain protein [Gammaproteobacteria bacterium]|jgi:hypothetical protein|nr:primosomal replication protein PriB/PriC domain protein [Gammaproteobacteria bacterium]
MSTQERLDAYLTAERKVLAGQSVRFGERQLSYADLAEIRKAIIQLKAELAAESGQLGPSRGSLRFRTAVFNR